MITRDCTCFWTDPSTWTTHYGAAEPGSQMEPNPDCPVHFPKSESEYDCIHNKERETEDD